MAIPKIFLTDFRIKRAGLCKYRGTICEMIIDYIIFCLAQSFLRPQGLGSAESGIVLLYSEHFGLSRIRSDREKESPKRKTKPKQTHSKPFFPRSIFNFSPKSRIFEDFRQTFLCKTKPIFPKFKIKNKGLTAASHNSRMVSFFLVDFFSQLIKIIGSSLTISPLNDKINQD